VAAASENALRNKNKKEKRLRAKEIIARGMWELRIRHVGTHIRELRVESPLLSFFFFGFFFLFAGVAGVAVNGHSLT